MNRRVAFNHALLYAAELANQAGLPLLVYEGLTCSYLYASDRLHTFVLEGVPDTEARLRKLGIGYVFYLRRRHLDPTTFCSGWLMEPPPWSPMTIRLSSLANTTAAFPKAGHSLLCGGFELHCPDESDRKARVWRLHHPAQDP